ncbi:hypothetical protein BDV95DRAFT_588804 [Massariosphaeria phaeospora]|uniref:Rhodopsin domain-containing protein n=1 Tax=Massariosphaeria phaeospora TaxID=100035 RepID=A0A7C8IJ20_9PLEO|nr:hypothetical protein BDV95DRAFT_588804 [Massariosphaeria phaeospora]
MDPALIATMSPEEQAAFMTALLEGPALEAPPGVMYDFENPGGNHALGYGIVILGGVLATISVLLRLHSRLLIKRVNIEDALLIAALGLYAGHEYCVYSLALFPGMQVHQWNVQLKNMIPILYNIHIGSVFYGLIIMLLKAAILLDWIRIFVPHGQRNAMFWISHAMIWSNVLFYGVGTLVELFQCTPREKIWNPLVEGSCPINMKSHNIASGVINLVSDLIIIGLPQQMIWKMQISRPTKIGISLLFAIGVFACASAAVRLYYIYRLLNSPDQLFTVSEAGLWAIGEMTAGFMIMGIPSLPKVVKSLPYSESVLSLLRSLTRPGSSGQQTNSRRGLPSWYKPAPKKRPNQFEVSELNEHDLLSLKETNSHRPSGSTTEV